MKVLLFEDQEIHPDAVKILKDRGFEIITERTDIYDRTQIEAFFIRSYTNADSDLLQQFPNLRFILRAGVGLDNVDLKYCEQLKIRVFNSPGSNANAVSELVICQMILLLRDFPQQMSLLRQGKWRSETFMGTELKEKTVGLVGCGAIGRLVAEKLIAFGVKDMICFDPFLDQESLIPRHITKCELEEVFRKSDIITFHLPLNSETRHEVDKKRLSLMKKGAFIVNTSRGAVINEPDLIDALQTGALGGAALDVFENEPHINPRLLDFPNVVLTPHVGSFSMESDREMSVEAVLNFLKSLDSEKINGPLH